MKLKAIHCKNCNDVVYSRTQRDFRECSCGYVFVNGGFHHFKCGALPGAEFKTTTIDVDVTLQVLHEDWNTMADNYGIV